MKKFIRRLSALALSAVMITTPAWAVTEYGESETWFDSVWALISDFGLKAENNPYVLQNYINTYLKDHPDELYNVLNGILAEMDTHSMYMSAEKYSEGFSTLEGFVGIGVGLRDTESGVQITEIMYNSAAGEAGLQVGDVIVQVDGKDITGIKSEELAKLLRGEEGTKVTMVLRRQGREVKAECTRRKINQTYVSGKTLADGVEYIKISAIGSESDGKVFAKLWDGLDEKNTRAVILDLRGNGGGVINVAVEMADRMIQREGVYYAGVHWREDQGGLERHYSTGGGLPLNKMVVLVDGGTASAAELLAGGLKETGTAMLLGEKTYGKGQGQYHFSLMNGDKLVITTLELELPRTGGYEGEGITPDIQMGNRKMTVDEDILSPLDVTKTLRFGDQSDDVYAMTERLTLLGLMQEATDIFDGDTVDAVARFRANNGLEPVLYASPDMLQMLNESMKNLDGETYMVDDQLLTALNICKAAAKEPQQYISNPDGTWVKK